MNYKEFIELCREHDINYTSMNNFSTKPDQNRNWFMYSIYNVRFLLTVYNKKTCQYEVAKSFEYYSNLLEEIHSIIEKYKSDCFSITIYDRMNPSIYMNRAVRTITKSSHDYFETNNGIDRLAVIRSFYTRPNSLGGVQNEVNFEKISGLDITDSESIYKRFLENYQQALQYKNIFIEHDVLENMKPFCVFISCRDTNHAKSISRMFGPTLKTFSKYFAYYQNRNIHNSVNKRIVLECCNTDTLAVVIHKYNIRDLLKLKLFGSGVFISDVLFLDKILNQNYYSIYDDFSFISDKIDLSFYDVDKCMDNF